VLRVAFWQTKKFVATDKICFTVWSAQTHCKKKTRLRTVFCQADRVLRARARRWDDVLPGHFSLALARRLGKVTEDFSPPWLAAR